MPDLKGKIALVTGGARGLGQETAVELAACGATVAVADRKFEAAREERRHVANRACLVRNPE